MTERDAWLCSVLFTAIAVNGYILARVVGWL